MISCAPPLKPRASSRALHARQTAELGIFTKKKQGGGATFTFQINTPAGARQHAPDLPVALETHSQRPPPQPDPSIHASAIPAAGFPIQCLTRGAWAMLIPRIAETSAGQSIPARRLVRSTDHISDEQPDPSSASVCSESALTTSPMATLHHGLEKGPTLHQTLSPAASVQRNGALRPIGSSKPRYE